MKKENAIAAKIRDTTTVKITARLLPAAELNSSEKYNEAE
jgi:hypothetical protein